MKELWKDSRLGPRFWEKVERQANGCWLWQGKPTTEGYGRFTHEGRRTYAHRVAYLALVGPLFKSLHIDHLCRVRLCVNPDHLEQVTHRENILRGVSPMVTLHNEGRCIRGHAFTEENTYVRPDNGRAACIKCIRARKSSGPRRLCLDCNCPTRAHSGVCRSCITSRRRAAQLKAAS